MRENFMGMEEVRTLTTELQRSIDERLDKFEEKIDKKLEDLEKKVIGTCREECQQRLNSVRKTLLECVQEEKNELKEDIKKSLEDGLFVLKKIDLVTVPETEDVESSASSPQPVISAIPQRKQSTPRIPKVNWKNYPKQDDFLRKEHEALGWKKNSLVKKIIFERGLKRKLWSDEEVWKKRVSYKVDAQYKANHLMSDARSCYSDKQ
jgi:hypothetical protein